MHVMLDMAWPTLAMMYTYWYYSLFVIQKARFVLLCCWFESAVSRLLVYLLGQQIRHSADFEVNLCKAPQPHHRTPSAVWLQMYFYQCFHCATCLHSPHMNTHGGCRPAHHSWRYCRHSFEKRDLKGSVHIQRFIHPAVTHSPDCLYLFD